MYKLEKLKFQNTLKDFQVIQVPSAPRPRKQNLMKTLAHESSILSL